MLMQLFTKGFPSAVAACAIEAPSISTAKTSGKCQQKTKIGLSLVLSLIILAACGQPVANHTGQTKVSAS